jgi:ribose transport system permease protein
MSTMTKTPLEPAPALERPPAPKRAASPRRRPKLAPISGLFVWAGVVVLFTLLEPATFATGINARIILSNEAIAGVMALGLLLPLAADQFDLSIAAVMGLATVVVGSLMAKAGWSPVAAVAATLALGMLVGAVNGFLVVKLRISSFIATLGMSSILAAAIYRVSNGQDIIEGIPRSFVAAGQNDLLSIPLPVIYMLALAAVLYFVLEHTPFGRNLYATGYNAEASRLSGVPTGRMSFIALVCSATLASLAGVLLTAKIGTAPYDAGAPYLLPAFAAALLGSTQFHPGRVNVLGTLVAIYLLATGVKGLELMYPNNPWIDDLFQGITLIIAVGLTVLAPSAARRRRRQRAVAEGHAEGG